MGQWYVRVRGQKPLGPVTTEQLAAGIGAGQVPVDAVVCRVGGSKWSPLAPVRRAGPPLERPTRNKHLPTADAADPSVRGRRPPEPHPRRLLPRHNATATCLAN